MKTTIMSKSDKLNTNYELSGDGNLAIHAFNINECRILTIPGLENDA